MNKLNLTRTIFTIVASCLSIPIFFSFSASASSVKAKITGAMSFWVGGRSADGYKDNQNVTKSLSNNQKNFVFYSQANIAANITSLEDSGFLYGATINLSTSTRTSFTPGSMIFAESYFGRFEAGAASTTAQSMSVSAYTIAAGTGDDFLRYASLARKIDNSNLITDYYTSPTDYSIVYAGGFEGRNEQARLVSYFSPKFHGLQFGLSYTPDVSNIGSGDIKPDAKNITFISTSRPNSSYKVGVKSMVSAAFTYEWDFSEDANAKIGGGYEFGETKTTKISASEDNSNKFKDFSLYNLGIVYTYGNYSVGFSYADNGKSFASKELSYAYPKIKNKLYTYGAAYNQGPFALSLVFLKNEKFNGDLNAATLSGQYKLAPGLLTYIEITPYQYKYKGFRGENIIGRRIDNSTQKGYVYLLGSKIYF
ncbi:MAG: porin [Rickettsiaceae bacterium]|nr:porin [Rickettsiaceae bacterium]